MNEHFYQIDYFSFQDLRHDVHLEDGPGLDDDRGPDGRIRFSLQTLHSTNLRRTYQKNEDSLNRIKTFYLLNIPISICFFVIV